MSLLPFPVGHVALFAPQRVVALVGLLAGGSPHVAGSHGRAGVPAPSLVPTRGRHLDCCFWAALTYRTFCPRDRTYRVRVLDALRIRKERWFCFEAAKLHGVCNSPEKTMDLLLDLCVKSISRSPCEKNLPFDLLKLFLSSQVSSVYEARCAGERNAGAKPNGFHRKISSSASSGSEGSGSDGGGEWADPGEEELFSRTHL